MGGFVYWSMLFFFDVVFIKECGFDMFMDEIIFVFKIE